MRFLDPGFLLGLLAVAVPVILHLLLRRRLPKIEFPLTRLVARAEAVQQPRRRLNRLLLLLARAALLALLALALARLVLGGSRMAATGPIAVAVLVDDSLSMRARAANGSSVFDAGRDMAASMLAALPEGSQATVLALSRADDPLAGRLVTPAEARRDLQALEPGYRALESRPGIVAALRALDASALPDRRLVLVSDLARHGLSDLALPSDTSPRRKGLVILSPERAPGPNLAVSGLDAVVLPGGRLRLTARASAWGEEGSRHRAEIEVFTSDVSGNGRVAARQGVDVLSGSVAERRFEIAAPPEGVGESVTRLPADVLPADDERHAVHVIRRTPRLLVIDGDPQNLSFGSETFYLEKALAPGVGLDLGARFTTHSEWRPEDLEGCAVAVLANVPDLTAERAAALERAVRRGMGLVVALGNRIDQRAWNGTLAPLLPATLGLVTRPAAPAAVLPGGAMDLPRVRAWAWHDLQPHPGSRTLARLAGGHPLIVEGDVGEGRVLLLGTSLDRDWTDLPISPWFLAFVRDAVARVSPRAEASALAPVVVGAVQDLSALELGPAATVTTAEGDVPIRDGGVVPLVPGLHVVREDGAVRAAFAAVLDPIESDLGRDSAEQVARQLAPALDVGAIVEGGGAGLVGGIAAWKALLVALACLLGAESWLARRAA